MPVFVPLVRGDTGISFLVRGGGQIVGVSPGTMFVCNDGGGEKLKVWWLSFVAAALVLAQQTLNKSAINRETEMRINM
jgi:hypothetical protein